MAIFHHTLQRLCRSQRGAVAILFGLVIMALCAVLGLAFDSARGYTARSELQGAVDAAALAAGRTFGLDQVTVVEDATSYFDANYQSGFLSGTLAEFDVDVNEDSEEITVTATAIIPTSIMQVFGKDSMTVSAEAVAIAQHHQLELSLIVDVTGSMLGTDDSGVVKIESLQSAAHEMVEILYGDNDTVPNIWLSIVPFTTAVNVGPGQTGWLASYDPDDYEPVNWTGCVEARAESYDRDDTPPNIEAFAPYFWPSGVYGFNYWPPIIDAVHEGPNAWCPVNAVTPLTGNRTLLDSQIDALVADGATIPNVGLVWGWRSISPRWRGQWTGVDASLPLDADTPDLTKAVVFMTDGATDWWWSDYTPYGFLDDARLGTTNEALVEAEIDNRVRTICENIKAEGIELYTIMFDLSSTYIEDMYRTCASSPDHFFDASNGAELEEAFKRIGRRLTALRLKK